MEILKNFSQNIANYLLGFLIAIMILLFLNYSITYFQNIDFELKTKRIITIISIISFGISFIYFGVSSVGISFLLESPQIESEYSDLIRHLKKIKHSIIQISITNIAWILIVLNINNQTVELNTYKFFAIIIIPILLNVLMIIYYLKSKRKINKTFA